MAQAVYRANELMIGPRCTSPAARGMEIGYFAALLMRIGVPKETAAGEHRVALVPEVVGRLKAKGLDVTVQSGAGTDALLPDGAFSEAGAPRTPEASPGRGAGVLVVIAPPGPQLIPG